MPRPPSNAWTLKYNYIAGDSHLEESACRSQNYDNNYGYAKGVGDWPLLIAQIGEAMRSLEVPSIRAVSSKASVVPLRVRAG